MSDFQRYTPEELQNSTNPPPESMDCLEFDHEGVRFRVFGVLHGITGGLNQEYVSFVKETIRSTQGLKLAEKGMKQLYSGCGIDAELEDWLVLRRIDCLTMGCQLLADPRCFWMITIDALREMLRKKDPYIANKRRNITELGESPYFHYLDEYQRRELIGFMPSKDAISKDLFSMSKWYRTILPRQRHTKIEHPQWERLLLLERVMHIQCHSVHMLNYALAYAKKHDHNLVNLFVGETHNTDMHFLAGNSQAFYDSLDEESRMTMDKIVSQTALFGGERKSSIALRFYGKKFNYLLFLIMGAMVPLSMYTILFIGFLD